VAGGLAGRRGVPAGGSEAAVPPGRPGEGVDLMKHRALNSLNDQLGDPVTTLETDGTAGISIEQRDPDLATVPRIHSSRSVHQRNAVPRGQARTRMHECGIAVGQRNGHAGGHHGPLAGAEFHIGGGEQIGARVTGMSTDRQRDTRIQPLDKDMHRVRFGIRYRPGGRSPCGVHGRDLTVDWVIPPTFRPGPDPMGTGRGYGGGGGFGSAGGSGSRPRK
jgi:hypothetical protein